MESESMGPCREKYWEELNSDEKLERMRNEVKGFMRQVEDLAAKINNLDHHVHLTITRLRSPEMNDSSGDRARGEAMICSSDRLTRRPPAASYSGWVIRSQVPGKTGQAATNTFNSRRKSW